MTIFYFRRFALVAACFALLWVPSAFGQSFIIDDFEDGQPFSLTTNEADGMLTSTASASVPGGVRHMIMQSSMDPEKQGSADLSFTSDDDALVLNAFSPPNNGFIIGSMYYGSPIPDQAELNLDLSDKGDAFYIDLVQGTLDTHRWSGFYIIVSADGVRPRFPDGTGTKDFLMPRGHGRHEIPFSYFGSGFDPTDVDSLRFTFWSGEARIDTPPLRIFEIGVVSNVPEPSSVLLALLTLTGACIVRQRWRASIVS